MFARHMNFLMPKPRSRFLIVLCLAAVTSSGCLTNKVADASKRKALEIVTAAPTSKTPPRADASPPSDPESVNAPPQAEDGADKAQGRGPHSPRQVKEKRLYIDGSKSMAGFAGQGGDFDRFFSEIGYVLDDPVVYKFGSPTKNSAPKYADLVKPTPLGQAQRSPQFYDLQNNPDDVLFTELDQSGTDALSVYVSDGVYSASDARAGSKVLTPLAKWFESGRVLGIFVLRAPFRGDFYSEKLCAEAKGQRCWLRDVKVAERPFYAFVFSPDEESFRRFQRKLEDKFKGMKTLVFSDGALTSEGLTLPEDDSIYDSGEQPEGYYWQMFTSQLFSTQNSANLSFGLSYTVDKEYPLSKTSPRVSARYYLWDNEKGDFVDGELPSSFKIIPGEKDSDQTDPAPPQEQSSRAAPPSLYGASLTRVSAQVSTAERGRAKPTFAQGGGGSRPPKARPKPGDKTAQKPETDSSPPAPAAETDGAQHAGFQLRVPRDARGLYGFYYLQIGIEVDEISPEIEGLSTDDDSDPLHANRTYRFAEVIKALLEAHLHGRLAAQMTPPLFLTIGN